MAKIALVAIIAMIVVAYSNDPESFKPWREVAGRIGVVVAKAAKATGDAANKLLRDGAHEDSVIDKTKDAVSDAGNSVKQAVTGK